MSSLQELLSFDSNSFCADLPSEIAVLPARFVTAVSTSVGTPCDACDVGGKSARLDVNRCAEEYSHK